MIRALLGAAFPIVGLALAAAFAGPDLVTGTSGAPMIVSGGDHVSLASANFNGEACASTLLYGETPDADKDEGVRVVAVALQPNGRTIELGTSETPGADGTIRETVLLLFDDKGQLVSASRPAEMQAAAHGDCVKAPKPSSRKPV
jgi:hypothetical protein